MHLRVRIFSGNGLFAFWWPTGLDGEDESDSAGVVLVFGRPRWVEQVGVLGDQQIVRGASQRGGVGWRAETDAGLAGQPAWSPRFTSGIICAVFLSLV